MKNKILKVLAIILTLCMLVLAAGCTKGDDSSEVEIVYVYEDELSSDTGTENSPQEDATVSDGGVTSSNSDATVSNDNTVSNQSDTTANSNTASESVNNSSKIGTAFVTSIKSSPPPSLAMIIDLYLSYNSS
jgi:hypothetical protein